MYNQAHKTHPVPEGAILHGGLSRLERKAIVHYRAHAPQIGLKEAFEPENSKERDPLFVDMFLSYTYNTESNLVST